MATDTGELSRTGYIATGDPYIDGKDREIKVHQVAGVRNFGVAAPRHTFGEYVPSSSGEPYMSRSEASRALSSSAKLKPKFVQERAFRPSSSAKRLGTPGGMDATFGKFEAMPGDVLQEHVATKRGPEEWEAIKKPMYTTVAGAKGYGNTPGVTFGATATLGGEYDSLRESQRRERLAERARLEGKPPFVSAAQSHGRTTLDVPEHSGVGASRVYSKDEKCLPLPEDPDAGKTKRAVLEERRAGEPEKPIVPPAGPKSGWQGSFGTVPEHIPEPYDPKAAELASKPTRLLSDKSRSKLVPEKLRERPAFKPGKGGKKTGYIASIARKTMQRRYNATVRSRRR
jgi:hypothetical protein